MSCHPEVQRDVGQEAGDPAPDSALALAVPDNTDVTNSDTETLPMDGRALLTIAQEPPQPAQTSWLHNLLVLLGGALAAASTARFFFV